MRRLRNRLSIKTPVTHPKLIMNETISNRSVAAWFPVHIVPLLPRSPNIPAIHGTVATIEPFAVPSLLHISVTTADITINKDNSIIKPQLIDRNIYLLVRILAGFPPTIQYSGTSFVTTLPAPTIECDPILIPSRITAPAPIHTSDPMNTP